MGKQPRAGQEGGKGTVFSDVRKLRKVAKLPQKPPFFGTSLFEKEAKMSELSP